MRLRYEFEEFSKNTKRDLKQLFEKIKKYPLISIFIIVAVLLLIAVPHWQVSLTGINDSEEKATQENQNRATLAQMLGGIAIGVGLYYTWRRVTIAEEELKVSKNGLVTERFTRAVDQLGALDQKGNSAIEIRLGGIYALERISKVSSYDYWPIMEILTAYVRKNSPTQKELKENTHTIEPISIDIQDEKSTKSKVSEVKKLPLDIEAIVTVIRRREKYYGNGETNSLDLQEVCFQGADLRKANLRKAYLKGADLRKANLKEANLREANLKGANLGEAFLMGANLKGANLKETKNLTVFQLFQVRTLHNTMLDKDLREKLEHEDQDKYQSLIKDYQTTLYG